MGKGAIEADVVDVDDAVPRSVVWGDLQAGLESFA